MRGPGPLGSSLFRLTKEARRNTRRQIVVVSYSPFGRFPVDLEAHELQDKDVYRNFGFHGRSVSRREALRPHSRLHSRGE